MFSFISKLFSTENEIPEKYAGLIAKVKSTSKQYYQCRKLSDYDGNDQISRLDQRELCEFITAAAFDEDKDWLKRSLIHQYVNSLLMRKLPFTHDEIVGFLVGKVRKKYNYSLGVGRVNKVIENHLKENELTDQLKKAIADLIKSLERNHQTAETRKWVIKLKELSGEDSLRNPLVKGEAWTDQALATGFDEQSKQKSVARTPDNFSDILGKFS